MHSTLLHCINIFKTSSSFASPTFPKSGKPTKGRRRDLTEEETDEIKEAFDLFDNDKDNELDYHEFKVMKFGLFLNSSSTFFLVLGWTSSIRF